MTTYRALIADNSSQDIDNHQEIRCEVKSLQTPTPTEGQVLIKLEYSSINYKDALAVTGKGKILRSLPLTPGIDGAGQVIASKHPKYKAGDFVLFTGCNFGEKFAGGFSEMALANGDLLIPLPEDLTSKTAMIIGTAGFTAGLALYQMQLNDIHKGKVAITGATGGVGSLTTSLFSAKGFECEAWTRKSTEQEWLEKLGASEVKNIANQNWETRALEKGTYAGAVDNVGGKILPYLLARTELHGSVASIGMALGSDFQASVFPFILRGVNLLGISSNNCTWDIRKKVWQLWNDQAYDTPWDELLQLEIGLEDIPKTCESFISGKVKGRTLIKF